MSKDFLKELHELLLFNENIKVISLGNTKINDDSLDFLDNLPKK